MLGPIDPNFLENTPNYIVQLQRELEDAVIKDICRRIRLSGEMTESALHQMIALRNRGFDFPHIQKRMMDTEHLTQQELDDVFDRALERNQQYYNHLIKKQDLLPSHFSFARAEAQFEMIRRQTKGEFRNITRSMGFIVDVGGQKQFMPIAQTYQHILDSAYMQISSGAFDYNTAIKSAVVNLSNSGLQYVDYASGWHNRIDVAARRAVLTGINQGAAQYSAQAMVELDTDLVEVTAHAGARDTGKGYNNHKAWQGKVYSFSGRDKRYPSLIEVCGYGFGGGLAGWNCRHSFYPFVEGVSERTYTDKQLKNIDPPPFAYQGRRYTAYEATQQQRKIETAIRAQERKLIGLDAAGLDEEYQNAAIRLRRLRQEYKQFSAAAGLRTQPARAKVPGWGRSQAAKARKGQR